MHELVLIFTDLFIAAGAPRPQSAPALPALSTLVSRGQSRTTGDWRRWALQEYACHDTDRVPVAAISRRAATSQVEERDSRSWWVATPVHLEAGLTQVRMGEQLPYLDGEEWDTLANGFNRAFAVDGFSLEAGHASGFISARTMLDASTVDPLRLLGQNVELALPSGPGSAPLRRLLTEVQMWLHDHPLNEKREQRGLPTVNGLWIWGGGVEPAGLRAAKLPHLATELPFLSGLWRLLKGPAAVPAASFAALRTQQIDRAIVALTCMSDTRSPARALDSIEQEWMAPALRAFKVGGLRRVLLHVNDRLFTITRADMYRFWRPRLSWLESVA
ncbi:MAG TPA: hypothetical protein VEZ88_04430 [Steroidobacteraceae bacterium]|nr:hypothetical protein [Steroidobacteraceae bacterium]